MVTALVSRRSSSWELVKQNQYSRNPTTANTNVMRVRKACSSAGSVAYRVIWGAMIAARASMVTIGPSIRHTPSRARSTGSLVMTVAREP